MVFYILIFTFLDRRQEDKKTKESELNGSKYFGNLISSGMWFWFISFCS